MARERLGSMGVLPIRELVVQLSMGSWGISFQVDEELTRACFLRCEQSDERLRDEGKQEASASE